MLIPEEFAQLLDELNLLALKRLAGRPQDREDVARLQEFYGLSSQDAPADDADENEL